MSGGCSEPPCGDCDSVTSTNAYFADLLKFLKTCVIKPPGMGTCEEGSLTLLASPSDGTTSATTIFETTVNRKNGRERLFKNLLEALQSRRPDIEKLELTSTNSENKVPYIEIANEILQDFVSSEENSRDNADDLENGGAASYGKPLKMSEIYQGNIAQRTFPIDTFPYNRGIQATTLYLKCLGIDRSEIISIFRADARIVAEAHRTGESGSSASPTSSDADAARALFSEAASVWHRAVVAETLSLQPLDVAVITREDIYTSKLLSLATGRHFQNASGVSSSRLGGLDTPEVCKSWGYATVGDMTDDDEERASGLCFISGQFLPRSGLSFVELSELLRTVQFSRRLVVVNAEGSKKVDGQLSTMRLRARDIPGMLPEETPAGLLTEQLCHELQAFIRLKTRLGWPISRLDAVLSGLAESYVARGLASPETARDISCQLLADLAHVVTLSALAAMDPDDLVSLWATTLYTNGTGSVYQRVFQRRAQFLPGGNIFTPTAGGKYFERQEPIGQHLYALMAALSQTQAGLECLLQACGITSSNGGYGEPVTMSVVTQLYQQHVLCKLLGVEPRESLAVQRSMPVGVNLIQDPQTTLEFVQKWRKLLDADWTPSDLIAILDSGDATTALPSEMNHSAPLTAHVTSSRTATVASKLELSPAEKEFWTTSSLIPQLSLDAPSIEQLCSLEGYRNLRDNFMTDGNGERLLDLLAWIENPTTTGLGGAVTMKDFAVRVSGVLGWLEAEVTTVLDLKYTGLTAGEIISRFRNIEELVALSAIMGVSRRLRLAPNQQGVVQRLLPVLFEIGTPTPPGNIKRDLEIAARLETCLSDAQATQCNHELGKSQNAVLVRHLLEQPHIKGLGISDTDGLFNHFLLDMQVGAQPETTRVEAAISSIQLLVQRCLLGVEPGDHRIDKQKWASMQRFSVWQATRKATIYSEDWKEPESPQERD